MTDLAASASDIEAVAKAIFYLRCKLANDVEPRHRHPMLYRDYKWADLPASEKAYYCDMAIASLTTIGISCPKAPVFEQVA